MNRREKVEHIESVCLMLGIYADEGITIQKVPNGWRVTTDDPDYVPLTWPELDMAITDFISISEMAWSDSPEELMKLN